MIHVERRALNQAVGRCIRHKGDYGAILLLDHRFTQLPKLRKLSGWWAPAPSPPALSCRLSLIVCPAFTIVFL